MAWQISCPVAQAITNGSHESHWSLWLRDELHELTESDRHTLTSTSLWLNDERMDADQKLICKDLDCLDSYQSVLNC